MRYVAVFTMPVPRHGVEIPSPFEHPPSHLSGICEGRRYFSFFSSGRRKNNSNKPSEQDLNNTSTSRKRFADEEQSSSSPREK
ncbi:hypothetical protein TNCV_4537351 [Trichonephila clavipes]|nr:hypothetical protein TNCV_4537351 [Trichonephila clavipes]